MPLRSNPITRALRTYNSAMYAARTTYHTVKSIKRRLQTKKSNTASSIVSKVRRRTRGALMNNPKAFDRSTMAGQKRRDDLAKKLRTMSRPKRSKTGSLQGIKGLKKPLARKPYSGKIELTRGMTGGQLRRKAIVHVVKGISGEELKAARGNRKEAATRLRAMHSGGGQGGAGFNVTKSLTKARLGGGKLSSGGDGKDNYIKRAATAYRKAFGGK